MRALGSLASEVANRVTRATRSINLSNRFRCCSGGMHQNVSKVVGCPFDLVEVALMNDVICFQDPDVGINLLSALVRCSFSTLYAR